VLGREPCINLSDHPERAPAGTDAVRVERLGTAGFERIGRLPSAGVMVL
jgi:hypothetical protein